MMSQQEAQITDVTDEIRDNNADNNGDKRSAAGDRSGGASVTPAGAAVGARDSCLLEREAYIHNWGVSESALLLYFYFTFVCKKLRGILNLFIQNLSLPHLRCC